MLIYPDFPLFAMIFHELPKIILINPGLSWFGIGWFGIDYETTEKYLDKIYFEWSEEI